MLKELEETQIFQTIKNKFIEKNKFIFAGKLLQRTYQQFPENIALIENERKLTYREFYFRTLLLSKKLASYDINPHDRVMIYCENSIEFCIYYFAAWQLGAVVVPVNIFLHEKELEHIVEDATPKIILTLQQSKQKLEQSLPNNHTQKNTPILTEEIIDWQEAVPHQIESIHKDFKIKSLSHSDLCLLLYTSGTTGKPKGVMLSSENILTNLAQAQARLKMIGLSNKERFFCVIPLFHVFAQNICFWVPIALGSTVILVKRIERKLISQGLQKQPTIFCGVPALYGLLCLMKTAPLDSIKIFISGADAISDKIRSAFALIYGRRICSGYGLTESSPLISANYHNDQQPTNTVGYPVAAIKCDIRNKDGVSLKQGGIGTLWVQGRNIMIGYYNDPKATKSVLQNGWLNTGDLASFQQNGMLAINGRSKDLIINKGLNIYPQEIENVLMMHPTVFKAAVVGKNEEMSGQVPIAFVATKKLDSTLQASLRELCKNNLAGYKVPKKFVCLEDLPMNATGKVDKKQLNIIE